MFRMTVFPRTCDSSIDMKKLFSFEHSLELLALLIAVLAVIGVLQTFIVGEHFVIPTMILVVAVLFGNLARFAMRGKVWAKHFLFWIFFVAACHTFFALFWAKTPRELLGSAFYFVYGTEFLLFSTLSWLYARKNALFG
jgi:hypothetical protein